ncbi:hypothetical protein [Streptomyces buecherae]|uniref:FHA domain-containing protein n=1 Tax=Streptomyces buecherae TaxID=2763006 RepID=A0A7H8N405_9ACTN|nr:hypothetical protein [Streptomyces buecherae]QKW49043.1 hypothetical protein HUT08_05230 [Streptomyces buecherae]
MTAKPASQVRPLPRGFGSPSRTVPTAPPGTLFGLGANGGMRVAPDANLRLLFGRNEPEVHVCVGLTDALVSRRQGLIVRESAHWVLHNTGRLPILFPGPRLVLGGDQAHLPTGYTPLFVVSSRHQHLLEVRVTAPGQPPGPRDGPERYEETRADIRRLRPEERLVLVCLARRYLRHGPHPQPLTWAQVGDELSRLRPAERWSPKRAAHVVANVRGRLSGENGVPGLLEDEVAQPVGNALNHNLITDLLTTTTIASADLRLPRPRP